MDFKHTILAAMLLTAFGITSCGRSGQMADPNAADSIAVADSINNDGAGHAAGAPFTSHTERAEVKTGEAFCALQADVPAGDSEMDQNIWRELVRQMQQVTISGDEASSKRSCPADVSRPEVVTHFCRQYHGELKREYQTMAGDDPENRPLPMEFHLALTQQMDTERFVIYSHEMTVWMGGPHPNGVAYDMVFIKPSGRLLTSVVKPSSLKAMQPLLVEGVKDYFRQCETPLEDGSPFSMLSVDDNIIPLPQHTPSFTPEGVAFCYQEYEIACYAAGRISFIIPYDKIMPHMTDEARSLVENIKWGK